LTMLHLLSLLPFYETWILASVDAASFCLAKVVVEAVTPELFGEVDPCVIADDQETQDESEDSDEDQVHGSVS
jgi:hypothetical protein